jgi:hypothetical protein
MKILVITQTIVTMLRLTLQRLMKLVTMETTVLLLTMI